MFNGEKQLLTEKLNLELKRRVAKSMIRSAVMCAYGTWNLRNQETDRLNVFQKLIIYILTKLSNKIAYLIKWKAFIPD